MLKEALFAVDDLSSEPLPVGVCFICACVCMFVHVRVVCLCCLFVVGNLSSLVCVYALL